MLVRYVNPPPRDIVERDGEYLTVGEPYLVYAIRLEPCGINYYLASDMYSFYPSLFPARDFLLLDGRLSRCWQAFQCLDEQTGEWFTELLHEDWGTNEFFYDLLTDGYPEQVAIWNRIKATIEREFGVEGPSQAYVPIPG